MKKISLFFKIIFFLLAGVCQVSAQKNSCQDVLYLKNGSIIRGYVLETIPDSSKVKIQTLDGNLFVFNLMEVQKIIKEVPEKTKGAEKNISDIPQKAVYTNMTDINIMAPSNAFIFGVGLRTAHGWRFGNHFSLMGGIGYERTIGNIGAWDANFFLGYIKAKVNVLKAKISPSFNFDMGWAIGFANHGYSSSIYPYNWGGLFINPCAGVRVKVSSKFGLDVGLGYRFQQANVGVSSIIKGYVLAHSLNFKLGFSF